MTGKFPPSTRPKKILIIKFSHIGDLVCTVPVLRGLRRTFPDAHIAWLIVKEWADVIKRDPDLNETIIFDRKEIDRSWYKPKGIRMNVDLLRKIRKEKFDWVIDLQGHIKSAFFGLVSGAPVRVGFSYAREGAPLLYTHRVDIPDSSHYVERHIELARLLGLEVGPEDYRLVIPDDVRAFVDEILRVNGLERRRFIICNPPTTWVTKHYPVKHWRAVISELAKEMPIVLTGGKGDTVLNREIAEGIEGKIIIASGETNLEQYMGLIESAALVICPDTGAAFVAAATGTPTVNIFGPSKPSRSGAYRLSEHVTAQVQCQGCLLTKYCPNFICMNSIDPKTVIDAAHKMLALKIDS